MSTYHALNFECVHIAGIEGTLEQNLGGDHNLQQQDQYHNNLWIHTDCN